MTPSLEGLTLSGLLTLSLQTALVLGVGLHLPRWLGMGDPAWRARFWYLLLVVTVLLPGGGLWDRPLLTFGSEMMVTAGDLWLEAMPLPSHRGLPWISLGVVWWIGFMFRLTWLTFGASALARWRRRGRAIVADPAISEAHRDAGVRPTPFFCSPDITTPVTFGLWRPVVLVPRDFNDLDPIRRRAIACHELVHVRRRDAWRVLGDEILRAVLWFHPAVWWLLPRIHLCREQMVDRLVVQHLAKGPYVEAMCHYAAGAPSWPPAPALSLFQPRHLHQRVAALTQEVSMSRQRTVSTVTALCALLASTAVAALVLFPWSQVHAGQGEKIHFVEGDVKAPVRTYGPAPSYPEGIAKEDRREGKVVIKATIDKDGKVTGMEVSESLDEAYDHAAMAAITQWQFEPATLDGVPVSVYYFLTINFRLA